MPTKIIMYRNDLKPDVVILCARNGVPVNLLAAEVEDVFFVGSRTIDGVPTTVFRRLATEVSSGGVARMEWVDGDTDDTGTLKVEVEVVWTSAKPETFRPVDENGEQQVFSIVADYG